MNRYLRVNMKKKASEYIVGSRPNTFKNFPQQQHSSGTRQQ
jgi:hypothetical protein